MNDHYDFYHDNFINDQVGFGPMFPEPSALCRMMVRTLAKDRDENDSSQIGLAISGREALDLKEV
ncbi:Uncharacterised protein [uncultured archaeon]|nr:Uncharacterised protein [uncultured archaeon]